MHRTSLARRGWLAAIAIAAGAPSAAAQGGTWALTNARIQTVTKGVIDRGTILIRNGLIEAVGTTVNIPPDARVLDLSNRTVIPGVLDLTSTIGLGSASTPETPGRPGQGSTPPVGRAQGLDPSRAIANELRLGSADLKAAREAGVTAVLVAPNRGAFRGQSALVPSRDSANQGSIIRAPVGMHLGFQGAQGGYPGSLLGVIAYQRQGFYDAMRYGQLMDRWRANPRGLARPEYDPGLDALVSVVRGTLPVFFDANNENEVRRAAKIAKEFGFKLTIVGATEGWRALDAVAGRTLVVSVNFPKAPEATGWSYRTAARHAPNDSAAADSAARKLLEGNAAALNQAGVRFALASGGLRAPEFLANVRKAVAAGLPATAALEALTIRAAEVAGVVEALGSIEPGKIANLVVTEGGELLSDSAKVRAVFVDGIRYEVVPPPAARATAGGGAPVEIGGTWAMTITSPQGPMDITLTVNQSGASFTGSMTSMMGTQEISDGQVSGKSVSWSMTINMGGQSVTISFQGEADGTRMTGSASLGTMGNATFTAERKQP